ncbi:MAG TPA: hypothetical protein VHV83_16350, partial [Armatimonadota bacterium]|nr:hypothetical protein [Armatimonadota bacterium]
MMHYRRPIHHKRVRQHQLISPPSVAPQVDSSRTTEALVPMRALTLIYHEDFEAEITGIVQEKMLVARYTKIRDVIGARTDIMQEADYAPNGQNNMLIIVATQ